MIARILLSAIVGVSAQAPTTVGGASFCNATAPCATGSTCSPVPVGGSHHYCVVDAPAPAQACPVQFPDENECCPGTVKANCTAAPNGRCNYNPDLPFCGGPRPPPINVCEYDKCSAAAPCAKGTACAPAGAFGIPASRCQSANCVADGDCADGARGGGGQCLAFMQPTMYCGQVRFVAHRPPLLPTSNTSNSNTQTTQHKPQPATTAGLLRLSKH